MQMEKQQTGKKKKPNHNCEPVIPDESSALQITAERSIQTPNWKYSSS